MIHFAHKKFLASVTDMATQSAHSLAFHRGLGVPTASAAPTPYTKYLDAETIARKAMSIAAEICVYTNGNLTVEALPA